MWAPKAFTLERMSHFTVSGVGIEADGNRRGQWQKCSSANPKTERSALHTPNGGVALV